MPLSLALPPFVIGPLLVTFLALNHRWLPALGYTKIADGFGDWLEHLILPAVALAINPIAEMARQLRGSLVEVLESPYVRTARAKGASPRRVIAKHALKNAAVPAVTILGLSVTRILGTAVLVEAVFAMPGIGTLALQAIQSRDYPVVQTITLITAGIVVAVNVLVDVSYGYLDPRLRVGRAR